MKKTALLTGLALFLTCGGCDLSHPQATAEAQRGAGLLASLGCAGCHTVPGVPGADGRVGPTLAGIASRIYIAGMIRNNPENLRRFVQNAQGIAPGGVMPDIPMKEADAHAIVAYLDTLR